MIKPKNKPLVSVLICTFNAASFIESTLNSVLSQTYEDMEVLVLDNASSDGTVKIILKMAEKYKRLKLYESKINLGAYPGLNYLLDRAKGTYIAINDHDDIWHPEKLERQIMFLEVNKGYPGCGTAIVNWYEKYRKYILRTLPHEGTTAWHTTLVFRNKGYRYDVAVPVATDFYFIKNILCARGSKVYNLDGPFVLRRIFKGSANLSGRWIKPAGLRRILMLDVNIIDKLALLNRLFLPSSFMDGLYLRTVYRSSIIPVERFADDDILKAYIGILS